MFFTQLYIDILVGVSLYDKLPGYMLLIKLAMSVGLNKSLTKS